MDGQMFVRVDERLLHGQILLKWLSYLSCANVVVLDEALSADPVSKSIMRSTLPRDKEFFAYDVQGGTFLLESRVLQGNSLVIMRDVSTLDYLIQHCTAVREVNIAKLPPGYGKRKICEHVYVSPSDIRLLQGIQDKGVVLYSQLVPDSERTLLPLFKAETEEG